MAGSLSRDEWLAAVADELGDGVPTLEEIDTILEVAGIAAHASERTAAPVTCWLLARAGRSPAEALATVRSIGGDQPERSEPAGG